MLAKELQIRLLAERGISKDEAEKIVNSDDNQSPEIGEGKFYTPENIGRIEKNKLSEGFIYGTDKIVKAIKNTKGLNYEEVTKKTPEGLVDVEATVNLLTENYDTIIKSSYTGKVDEQVKELESSLQIKTKKYQEDVDNANIKADKAINELNSFKSNTEILSDLPGEVTTEKGMLHHFKAEFVPFNENGKFYVKDQYGNIVKDEYGEKRLLIEVRNEFIDKNGYIKKDDIGSSGGSGSTGNFKTSSDFNKYCKDNGIDPMGSEGLALFNKSKKEGMQIES